MSGTATDKKSTSYADIVDYKALFADISQYGLSKEEEEKLKQICDKHLKDWDGGKVVSTNLGAMFTGWVYDLFALIQNIFKGDTSPADAGKGTFDRITSSIGNAFNKTGKQSDLEKLQQATVRIDIDLKQAGGNLARVADLISGQSEITASNNAPPPLLENGIYNQIRKTIDLPANAQASLSPLAVKEGETLTAPQFSASTKNTPLTGRS